MESISYEPFNNLIAELRNDGLVDHSESLNYLLNKVAWTTASELLGHLGDKIKEIRKEDSPELSEKTKIEMKNSMDMVRRVWPRFPAD